MIILLSIVRIAILPPNFCANDPLVPKALATSLENQFLLTGTLPPGQNGTEVTVYHAGMCRVPIPDPYSVPTGLIAGDCPDPADGCNLQ
jgi:hypothetical protein